MHLQPLPSTNQLLPIHSQYYPISCSWICSHWTKFHLKLVSFMNIFKKNGYRVNFINNCFTRLLDKNIEFKKKKVTVLRKPFILVFLYFGPLPSQTTIELRKSIKGILNFWKLHIAFKSQNKSNVNLLNDLFPKELASGVVHKFEYGFSCESYYGESIRHLNVRIGKHIEMPTWWKRKFNLWAVPLVVPII